MPVARHTPEHRRRVRTGCLTCRKRRRKCDERKPRCGSCETRGFSCKYPEVAFVTGSKFGCEETSQIPERPAKPYRAIRFVENGLSTISSNEAPKTTQNRGPEARENQGEDLLDVGDGVSGSLAGDSDPELDGGPSIRDSSSPQSKWSDYFSTKHATPIKNETAPLLHFQYNLAPWIEAGDLVSTFGTDIMLLAQSNQPILAAITTVASSHLEHIGSTTDGHVNYEKCKRLRQEASQSLAHEEPRVRRVGEALLALGEFFDLYPSQWRTFPFFQLDAWMRNSDLLHFGPPMETLLRLHLRIDLAASLLAEQPPLTHLAIAICHDNPPDLTRPSTNSTYNACLANLSGCLHLLHGNVTSASPPLTRSTEPEPLPPSPGSYFSSTWSSLWTSCQQWYHHRPLEMQPILEIRSVEAGQIDTKNDSSFPISVYTSSIALQCNIVYHITSRLLLSRKPRLLRLSSRQRHLTSQSWHSQQIAGIATRNDFAEQWDPILIAGLLWIASDMTHPSQQEALMACFHQISASTGIKLDEEINTLRERWHVSRTSGQLAN